MNILEQQRKLKVSVMNYDLSQVWQTHLLINNLREQIEKLMPKGLYDRQDLEHQVLFRLTTFDPSQINEMLIQTIIDEQYIILQNRLSNLGYDLEYLFRGLSGKSHDLNINDRLILCSEEGKLIAKNKFRSFNVEFKIVEDEKIISLFSNELHYIHKDRPKGETFGFYFAGDTIPWAVETTEPSIISKKYKRDALLAQGIDPNKAIELTRFYTLPGAPINAISLMDGLVGRYYKEKGMEALFTTTMPMYSKTKGSTIAGGINKVLLVKELAHKFVEENIAGKTCFRHIASSLEEHKGKKVLRTHPNFPTMHVVEVFKRINESSAQALSVLGNEKKVLYIKKRNKMIEVETKFKVNNISDTLQKVRSIATFDHTEYIRDVIWGSKEDGKKIRLRISDDFQFQKVEAIYKYKVSDDKGIKTEIEEYIYKGNSKDDAVKSILKEGDFVEENSYEKIRSIYKTNQVEITVDVYPYGTWLEIEGKVDDIWDIAKKLNYKKTDAITENADELYLAWIKKQGVNEMWDVRFGLNGKK